MDNNEISQPWDDVDNWTDEKAYLNWLRSSVRRIWTKHPVKINYIQAHRYKSNLGKKIKKNPNGMVWACTCESCGGTFRQTDCQVDHIDGGYGFSDWEGFIEWQKRILWVSFDDIRIVCKGCHSIITHAQRKGISFDEAKLDKKVIEFGKLKVDKQKETLTDYGISSDEMSNATKRKEAYRRIINED